MPLIHVKEDESFENALRRFKRKCEKSGILSELKKRQHYEKPSAKRKRKAIAARKKMLRKLAEERGEVGEGRKDARELRQVETLERQGEARLLGALDEDEEVEEVLGRERAVLRAEARQERRGLVEPGGRDRRTQRAHRAQVARQREAPRGLVRVGRGGGPEDRFAAALGGAKTPGEPKHAGPVELCVRWVHWEGDTRLRWWLRTGTGEPEA